MSSRGLRVSARSGPFSYSAPIVSAPRYSAPRSYGPTAAQLAREHKEQQKQARLRELSSITFGLNADGSMWVRDANSVLVTTKGELDLIWQEYASDLVAFLHGQLQTFGQDSALLARIHCDTPNPNLVREFVPAGFEEPSPQSPEPLTSPPRPEPAPPAQTLFGAITGANKRIRTAYEAEHTEAMNAWEAACAEAQREHQSREQRWRRERGEWAAKKAAHDAEQNELGQRHNELIRSDGEYARRVVCAAMEALSWPREMSVGISADDLSKGLKLDIDLPEIEDFPKQTAELHSSGRRLSLKNRTEKHLRREYAAHIHGILIRLAGVVFWCLPDLQEVTASGYSQRLNKATGHVEDQYLLSVVIDRGAFSRLNFSQLESLDPIEALAAFKLKRSMTATHVFTRIESS